VLATAAADYTFLAWSGASTSTSATLVLSMPGAAAPLSASFAECFPLSLSASGPAGVAASVSPSTSFACSANKYISGAALTLTVTVPIDVTFLRWSGSGTSGRVSPLAFSMPAAAASVTAEFAACVPVSQSATSGGSVVLASAWPHSCDSGLFPAGAPMTATATADASFALAQ